MIVRRRSYIHLFMVLLCVAMLGVGGLVLAINTYPATVPAPAPAPTPTLPPPPAPPPAPTPVPPDSVPPSPQPTFVTASMPAGPSTGKTKQILTFSTSAGTNVTGNLEYRFDWGDTSYSSWSSLPSVSYSWSSPGTYTIKAQARLVAGAHTSEWSPSNTVNIAAETFELSISVSPSGSGSVSLGSNDYDSGTPVTLTATPVSGYIFHHWGGDASGTSPTITITMDSDKDVVANFARQYTLSTSASPPGSGSVSPDSGIYDAGATVTLTATAASGYYFVSWSGIPTPAPAPTPTPPPPAPLTSIISIIMDSNKNVTANFAQIIPPYVRANPPTGPSTGEVNQLLTFSTSASTNIAGSIEYRFDWDDESYSSWSSSPSASHSWSSLGPYRIRTQARVIPAFTSEWSTGLGVVITSPAPQVINYTMQPSPGVSLGIPSWVRYGKFLNAGEEFKGTVSLSGYTPSIDWNSTWYFEVYDPQDNLVDKKSYTFSSGAVKSFSHTASHAGTWKIKVSHYSFYSRDLRIEILPAGWSKIDD